MSQKLSIISSQSDQTSEQGQTTSDRSTNSSTSIRPISVTSHRPIQVGSVGRNPIGRPSVQLANQPVIGRPSIGRPSVQLANQPVIGRPSVQLANQPVIGRPSIGRPSVQLANQPIPQTTQTTIDRSITTTRIGQPATTIGRPSVQAIPRATPRSTRKRSSRRKAATDLDLGLRRKPKLQLRLVDQPSIIEAEPYDQTVMSRSRYSPVVRSKTKQNLNISIMYRVVRNTLTMLRNRGYIIPSEFDDIWNMTANQFNIIYNRTIQEYNQTVPKSEEITLREHLSREFYLDQSKEVQGDPFKPNIPTGDSQPNIVFVYFPETPTDSKSTSKPQVNILTEYLLRRLNPGGEPPIHRALIVSEYKLSSPSQKDLLETKDITFELFTYQELVYLPSHHFLVPEHRRLSKEEFLESVITENFPFSRLKTIALDDPVIREKGYQVGDIISIIRRNYFYKHPIPITIEYRIVTRRSIDPKK